MKLLPFLQLIRWQTLVVIALTQYLIKYFLFAPFQIDTSLGDLEFSILVLASLCIAAAGNIILNIHNVAADSINKPKRVVIGSVITEKTGYNWFLALNILGVGLGFYLANYINQPGFSGFFILASAMLYLHAAQLKKIAVLGNLIPSLLMGFVILGVGIFDLLPAINRGNLVTQQVFFSILADYSLFVIMITLLLEIVGAQKDIQGHYNAGYSTLPIILGKQRTNRLIFLLTLFPLAAVVYYIYFYLFHSRAAVLYVLFLIVAPLLYFLIQILKAKTPKDFRSHSILLKGILITGILSLGLYRFILI